MRSLQTVTVQESGAEIAGEDLPALLERGEELVLQGRQVHPTGSAMMDLQSVAAVTCAKLARAQTEKFGSVALAEAVRAAFAIGLRAGLRGSLQVGAPIL